jgi:hypothetical protein
MKILLCVAAGLALACGPACYSGGDPLVGLLEGTRGDGPQIAWDLSAEPLPNIPFPNDVATRPDGRSPTGRRVNASLLAPTSEESRLRRHVSELDGFGTFAPIWITFESPDPTRPELSRLDLRNIADRQRADTAFADDVALLVNVSPTSRTYGQATVLDFGNGSFPLAVENEDDFFENDPRSCASNLLFDTYEEDLNGNGVLDPGEDTDSDGVLDHPNLWGTLDGHNDPSAYDPCTRERRDDGMDPYRDLITFYELETDTLWFRPVVPLEERTTYAVVLTRDLVGETGDPIQSPFRYVHHLQQTEALRPLFEDGLLARYGRSNDDVAFAWTFTTQSVTEGLVALREGLHGYGPFAHLAETYPPDVQALVPMSDANGVAAYRLKPEQFIAAIRLALENIDIGGFAGRVDDLLDTYGAVDSLVAGDIVSPDFLDAAGGVFDIDPRTGEGTHQGVSIRFLMAIPKKEYGRQPFPVALYCHGYTSLKLEALLAAGVLAKYGIATFVIDAYSHGLPLGPAYAPIIETLLQDLDAQGLLPFYRAISKDRARDLNGDAFVDPGADFWTNDMFHTRDIVRQTVVDYLQSLRVLQGFDGGRTWAVDLNGDGIANDLAGDFNADGTPDLGGPDVGYYVLGTSMGGIVSTILGGLDPAIEAAAPISPGGGLLEIGLRTDLGNVLRAVILPMLGPMVITTPKSGDPRLYNLQWMVNDLLSERTEAFATVGDIVATGQNCIADADCDDDARCTAGACTVVERELREGDLFEVRNLRNGEVDRVRVGPDRLVRAHVASDEGDPIHIAITRPDGTLVKEVDTFELEIDAFQGRGYGIGEPLVAIQNGFGFRRNTPSLRRLVGIAQLILEPGDPVNYAARYADPLFVRPEGASPTNVLFVLTMGDMTVPISTGVALARAAGVIDYLDVDPRYGMTQNDLLITYHVVEAVDKLRYFDKDFCRYDPRPVNFDVDDLSNGLHRDHLPRLAQEPVRPPVCSEATPPPECSQPCGKLPPLRAGSVTPNGVRAARIPAFRPEGMHAIDLPDSTKAFDGGTFVLNQIGLFLGSGGTILSDHPCLASNDCRSCAGEPDCPSIPPPPPTADELVP